MPSEIKDTLSNRSRVVQGAVAVVSNKTFGIKRHIYRFQDGKMIDYRTGKPVKASRVMAGEFSLLW